MSVTLAPEVDLQSFFSNLDFLNLFWFQVCSCLGQIAKHSVDLAEVVVEAEIFPRILHCLKDVDEYVRKNAATCVREIARHTPDLAKVR